ncbi:MAG: pH regulation protein F [Deltaproteobacteria bacterium]|nr:pH regulation protein F [Deltaproteobacteria bacterium]MCW5808884.1 pH regulation protein F [Deltaproteobacteria bacterium]
MHELRIGLAAFLVANVLAGLIRVARGPTFADRLLVAQLFGTTGVAVLLVLATDTERTSLRDVALVFAVLAPITVSAFARGGPAHWARRDDA